MIIRIFLDFYCSMLGFAHVGNPPFHRAYHVPSSEVYIIHVSIMLLVWVVVISCPTRPRAPPATVEDAIGN